MTISDAEWFREQARYERDLAASHRSTAWGALVHTENYPEGDAGRLNGVRQANDLNAAANERHDRALAYDRAADALALVESARGAEALAIEAYDTPTGQCARIRGGVSVYSYPPVEEPAREILAARLVATALKLRGEDGE